MAWVSGQFATMSALGAAFGLSVGTVRKWRTEEDWDAQKAEYRQRVEKKLEEKLVGKLTEVSHRHFLLWGSLDRQCAIRLGEATERGQVIALEELEAISRVMERSQRCQRIILGADEKGSKDEPVLEIVYDGIEAAILRAQEHLAVKEVSGDGSAAVVVGSAPTTTPALPSPSEGDSV